MRLSKIFQNMLRRYTGSCLQRVKGFKGFIVTELKNITVNDFDAKKSARYSWVLVVTEVSGTQCT